MWFETPDVEFSSSGDFAYINRESFGAPEFQIIKDFVEVSTTSFRYIQRYLATDGALYELYDPAGHTIQLSLTKLEFTKWGVATRDVDLPNLVHVSSHYAYKSEFFLLLGKTDEDPMHLLVVPNDENAPELKTIALTWAEARAMLNRKWEEKYGHVISDRDVSSEDVDAPEEETERESMDLQQLSIAPST